MTLEEICKRATDDAHGSLGDFLGSIYGLLCAEESSSYEYFRQFTEKYYWEFDAKDNAKSAMFQDDEVSEWVETYKRLTEGFVEYLSRQRFSEEKFYQKLWAYINDETLFPQTIDRALAFRVVCMHPLIPYYQTNDGLRMGNKEFKELLQKLLPQRNQVSFALRSKFKQKTERASVILDIFDTVADRNEKAVLMAIMLDTLEEQVRQNSGRK